MTSDFVCNICGKQFKSQKTLTQHNRDVHIELDIPCTLCDKTFRTKKHLANHKSQSHKVCVSEALNPSFETIINDFVASWKTLEDHFGIGCTLKIHIIGTHLLDAIKTTGEVVEQAHYRVNAFEKSHGYLVSDRKMQTPNAAEKQQRMMEHLNSHHLR